MLRSKEEMQKSGLKRSTDGRIIHNQAKLQQSSGHTQEEGEWERERESEEEREREREG